LFRQRKNSSTVSFPKITYRILYNPYLLKLNSELPLNKTPAAGDSLVSKDG
jgi:hypothetical protein